MANHLGVPCFLLVADPLDLPQVALLAVAI
jgi:hypothetical protein